MSGFSIDWLDLREDADRRARDGALLEQARQWLAGPGTGAIVVDLGAGTGSTLRALTADHSHATPLSWRLVDHDRELLAEAQRRHGQRHRIEACPTDLARVTDLPLAGARLVTASALFDLVSANFLETLASTLKAGDSRSSTGVYAALNYDGMTRWSPAHPLDDLVLDAFNKDQRRDKGFGPALGPDAGARMEQIFTHAGFTVRTASSPWNLDGTDQAMVDALIEGIAGAVEPDSRLDASSLKDWVRFRQSNAATGTCIVGHTDILALPEPDTKAH
ncbi:MAG: class I SAM-dependent methyltransferase [Pseudomonadota bacterium]